MITTDKTQLNINVLTQEQYEQAKSDETLDQDGLYMIPETEAIPTAVDYIVEEGTSGVWKYRKWNSGTVECWTQESVSTGALVMTQVSTSAIYISDEKYCPLPVGLFIDAPDFCQLGPQNTTYIVNIDYYPLLSDKDNIHFQVKKAGLSSAATDMRIFAIGKWK